MSEHVRERPSPARVPLGAFVDRTQHEQLHELARAQDRSMSSIVRTALTEHLERERPAERSE
jgi:hypothetical protein